MSMQATNSDSGLLGLLRITGPLTVLEMTDALEVTQTAVRQRLVRLMGQNAIQREVTRHARGRLRHSYSLTEKGMFMTRSNFTDLAMTPWGGDVSEEHSKFASQDAAAACPRTGRRLRSAVD